VELVCWVSPEVVVFVGTLICVKGGWCPSELVETVRGGANTGGRISWTDFESGDTTQEAILQLSTHTEKAHRCVLGIFLPSDNND
jgi:hypothetical protein